MKILIAYDGGIPAGRALELTAQIAIPLEAEVTVLSVIPVHAGRTRIDPWDDASVHAEQLKEARRILEGLGIEPILIEQAGDPAATIERVADDGGYDMVVVGSRGLGIMSRALQGSVSEHVATHSTATVLIAR